MKNLIGSNVSNAQLSHRKAFLSSGESCAFSKPDNGAVLNLEPTLPADASKKYSMFSSSRKIVKEFRNLYKFMISLVQQGGGGGGGC